MNQELFLCRGPFQSVPSVGHRRTELPVTSTRVTEYYQGRVMLSPKMLVWSTLCNMATSLNLRIVLVFSVVCNRMSYENAKSIPVFSQIFIRFYVHDVTLSSDLLLTQKSIYSNTVSYYFDQILYIPNLTLLSRSRAQSCPSHRWWWALVIRASTSPFELMGISKAGIPNVSNAYWHSIADP